MAGITIRRAQLADAPKVHQALQRLSEDMGDHHAADLDSLTRHGFSASPAFFALLALRQEDRGDTPDQTLGVLLASPVFSTTRGGAGLYVSDLWVADSARGEGLGQRLLAAALANAPADWTVTFLKLAVYDDNPGARRFYERLGFDPREGETVLDLRGPAFDRLRTRP